MVTFNICGKINGQWGTYPEVTKMRIHSITNGNYNNVNLNRTNNISKPVFKGKNFAKVLSEFKFKSFGNDAYARAFNGFRYLMENVLKEPNFQILNYDMYNELAAANTEEAFYDLLKNWYQEPFTKKSPIARDSEGLLINYTEDKNENILKFMSDGKCIFLKTKNAEYRGGEHDVFYTYGNSSNPNDSVVFG